MAAPSPTARRARAAPAKARSARPQFTGGGVAFGPKPRDYSQSTPRKMVRQALRAALSDRAAEDRVCLVDRWSFEVPKTKQAASSLESLGLDGAVLVVISGHDVIAERSFGNLPHVTIVEAGQLTAYDVVASDWVVFTDETVPGQVSDAPEGSVAVSSRPVRTEAEPGDEAEDAADDSAEDDAADAADPLDDDEADAVDEDADEDDADYGADAVDEDAAEDSDEDGTDAVDEASDDDEADAVDEDAAADEEEGK